MAQYRKKPIVINAILWDGKQVSEITDWVNSAMNKEPGAEGYLIRMGDKVHISTLEGEMTASPGDYILQGVSGEIYPCKPDIFEKTYEKV